MEAFRKQHAKELAELEAERRLQDTKSAELAMQLAMQLAEADSYFGSNSIAQPSNFLLAKLKGVVLGCVEGKQASSVVRFSKINQISRPNTSWKPLSLI